MPPEGTNTTQQRSGPRQNGVYQSFIFVLLNLVRDTDFEKLPSYSISKWEECKKLDISYFELKELEKSLGKQTVESQAQLSAPFINEYGDDLQQLRASLLSDTNVIQAFVQGPIRKWLRQHAGVLSIKMVSEILLHLGEATQLRPMMVQKGVLSLLVDLNSAVVA